MHLENVCYLITTATVPIKNMNFQVLKYVIWYQKGDVRNELLQPFHFSKGVSVWTFII